MIFDLAVFVGKAAVASWLVLGALFLGYPTLKRLAPMRDELHWTVKVPAYFGFAIGFVADVVFNATWGSVIFREAPQEWTFTERVKRHYYADSAGSTKAFKRYQAAEVWRRRINLIDPGHI